MFLFDLQTVGFWVLKKARFIADIETFRDIQIHSLLKGSFPRSPRVSLLQMFRYTKT
jgi:hypothetical protein